MSLKIPSKRIIFTLRVAPSLWKALEDAVANTDDPTVMLVQAQAKTYVGNGATSTSLSVQQQWDDHPGLPPTQALKNRFHAALEEGGYSVDIINTSVGEHASARTLSNQFMIQHLVTYFGVRNLRYNMPYDVDGRNDKFHETEYVDENGIVQKGVEDVIPSGIYAPLHYRMLGVTALSVIDPHSIYHKENLLRPFGKENVAILTSIPQIADEIIAQYKAVIRAGIFRIGAPDGWDKKDDPERNSATERVKQVALHIWNRMPDIHADYGGNSENFMRKIQFGIIKKRRRDHQGAPAKPQIEGFFGDVNGCECLLIDDLVDSGSSMTKSGEVLLRNGANKVGTAVCHGPATREALQFLLTSATEINGETKTILSHHIFTNTVTRLEEFHAELSPEEKSHISMLNCGSTLLPELAKPFPTLQLASPAPLNPLLKREEFMWHI